jgi:catechol-2,3-dioxygenase
MHLNHLNLAVTDVLAAEAFLTKHFGLRSGGGNAGLSVIFDDNGLVLTLMKAGRSWGDGYPGSFHIGFFVESRERVDEMYRALLEDGFDLEPPADTGHSYGFYVAAPGGFQVEVGA